ncbi:TIGR03936 family radical SAM-associated protein [Emergencia sp.]|uniref:TIGR03936 family radical SAM-associated protein n=1 Tax=Emergencia sp. TaxID=1926557 RepID=UPI003AF0B886
MNRYIIRFSKEGYIKYTSHLDMLRLFKRAFKKTRILLAYSQGFNPHPKMGFAQPLSLGYTSKCELLEFETTKSFDPLEIKERLTNVMPEGVELLDCRRLDTDVKSLASVVTEAEYEVIFPVPADMVNFQKLVENYLNQEQIIAEKRQKKTRKMVAVDIKGKIREMAITAGEKLTLHLKLDSGSNSNLSPEQVIATFLAYTGLDVKRYDVEVERTKINFDSKLQF